MSAEERRTDQKPRRPGGEGRSAAQIARLVLIGLGVLVILLLVLQNQDPVRTRFLIWGAEMPHFLLLAGVYLLGAVTGWIAHWWSRS